MSAFGMGKVAPSLGVACPPRDGVVERGCGAAVGKPCVGKRSGIELYNSHSARRKAADAKRTAEVEAARVAK